MLSIELFQETFQRFFCLSSGSTYRVLGATAEGKLNDRPREPNNYISITPTRGDRLSKHKSGQIHRLLIGELA